MALFHQIKSAADTKTNPVKPAKPTPSEKPIVKADPEAKKRGRPKSENAKELITLRIDPRVLAHYRSTGEGWQSRLNADLVKVCGLNSASRP